MKSSLHDFSGSGSVTGSGSGFGGGAPGAAVESLLLGSVVETRQNDDSAVGLAWSAVTRRFLLLRRRDRFNQTRDGTVDVGVILETEVKGQEKNGDNRGGIQS